MSFPLRCDNQMSTMPTSIGMNATMPMHTHMNPRRLATIAIAVTLALVLSSCLSANQTKMVNYINSSRRHVGKPAMKATETASAKAQRWAEHMAATGVVEHSGGGSRMSTAGLPTWCAAAENVAKALSTANAHDLWMKSASHKANILGNYNRVGTGVVRKGNYVYAVQVFYRTC